MLKNNEKINKEQTAEIRNKLQAAMTALDLISQGREVPKEFIENAKKGFE